MHTHYYYVAQGFGVPYSQDNYSGQDYYMGHGSTPIEDDSLVEEMSHVNAKKPSKRASKARKNDNKKNDQEPMIWTTAEEITL